MSAIQLKNPHLASYLNLTDSDGPAFHPIISALNSDGEISLPHLRTLCFSGIPEDYPSLRGLIYRLLLGYLPTRPTQWEDTLQKYRENYALFRKEFEGSGEERDREVWVDIEKDIRRTRMDVEFFYEPVDESITVEDVLSHRKPAVPFRPPFPSLFFDSDDLPPSCSDYIHQILANPQIEKHIDVMARILYIYAKLNPGVKYVQGMNEILAPIYYLFAKEQNPLFKGCAEEDTFFCFVALMAEIRDNFVRSLDLDPSGLSGQLLSIRDMLDRLSPSLSEHLGRLKVFPSYYAIKWVTLLFTQNFPLKALLSDEYRFSFFLYTCIAMLELNKPSILTEDFAGVMGLLQRPVHFTVEELLECAVRLMQEDEGVGKTKAE